VATYSVEPKVLIWAREECGLSFDQAVDDLKPHLAKEDPSSRLADIEAGKQPPTLSLLAAMSRVYNVSLVTLFWPSPPPRTEKPTDYRTIRGQAPTLSKATLLAIRNTVRWQATMMELVQDVPELYQPLDLPTVALRDDPARIADSERLRLGVTFEEQRKLKDANQAFNLWRWRIEDHGILVFALSMPLTDCRGFVFDGGSNIPAIVVNKQDDAAAQVFTLFHEYAHILLRQFGICGHSRDVDEREVETFSNSFAANFLMPTDEVIEQAELNSIDRHADIEIVLDAIPTMTRCFKVSGEAMVLRLEALRLAPYGLHSEYIRRMRVRKPRRGFGDGKSFHRRYLNKLGNRYVETVLTALRHGSINAAEADDMMDGVKGRHFRELEIELANRRKEYGFVR